MLALTATFNVSTEKKTSTSSQVRISAAVSTNRDGSRRPGSCCRGYCRSYCTRYILFLGVEEVAEFPRHELDRLVVRHHV